MGANGVTHVDTRARHVVDLSVPGAHLPFLGGALKRGTTALPLATCTTQCECSNRSNLAHIQPSDRPFTCFLVSLTRDSGNLKGHILTVISVKRCLSPLCNLDWVPTPGHILKARGWAADPSSLNNTRHTHNNGDGTAVQPGGGQNHAVVYAMSVHI